MDHVQQNCRLCANCTNGVIDDCFANGCVPANGNYGRTIYTINQRLPAPRSAFVKMIELLLI